MMQTSHSSQLLLIREFTFARYFPSLYPTKTQIGSGNKTFLEIDTLVRTMEANFSNTMLLKYILTFLRTLQMESMFPCVNLCY